MIHINLGTKTSEATLKFDVSWSQHEEKTVIAKEKEEWQTNLEGAMSEFAQSI